MANDMEAVPVPSSHTERSALVRVSFLPSPSLDDALHRFLKPQYEERTVPLYSESKLHLRYDQSNNDGPIYAPVDAQRLARDELRMRELGRQPIYMSNIEMSASSRGDIHLRFELKPTNAQRRLLGGFVLGSLITKLDDPIWVYTHFWHQVVSSEAAGRQEAMRLNQLLDAPQGSRNANDIARRFYVMQPQIIQRTGDLRSVK